MRRAIQPRMGEIEPEPFGQAGGTAPPAPRPGTGLRTQRRRHGAPGAPPPPAGHVAGRSRTRRTPVRRRRRAMPCWKPSISASYGARPERRRQAPRRLAHQTHDLLQMRADHGEIRLAARLAPHLLAGGVGARLRLDQVRRHRGRAGIGVAHQAKVGRAPRIRFLPSPQPPQDRRRRPARSAASATARPARQADRRVPHRRLAASLWRHPSPARDDASPIVAMRAKRAVSRS